MDIRRIISDLNEDQRRKKREEITSVPYVTKLTFLTLHFTLTTSSNILQRMEGNLHLVITVEVVAAQGKIVSQLIEAIKKYSPDTEDYLSTDDKKGGPINPVLAFETAFMATYPDKSVSEHPLYKYVKNISKFEGFDSDEFHGQSKENVDID